MTKSDAAVGRVGVVIRERLSSGGPALGVLVLFGDGNGARLEASAEPLFMARLEDAGAAQERADGVTGLRTVVEPVIDAIGAEVHCVRALTGSVLPDDLDEPAVPSGA